MADSDKPETKPTTSNGKRKLLKPRIPNIEVTEDRNRSKYVPHEREDYLLWRSLWLVPALVFTSYSSQALVKPLLGNAFPSIYYHFATFVSISAFSLFIPDDKSSQKIVVTLSAVLQILAALVTRPLTAKVMEYADDPFRAALIVHSLLSLPAIGLAGAPWLQWMHIYAEIDEPTAGGRLIFKVFSFIALTTIISFTESFLGKILLYFISIPPSATLFVFSILTFLLSTTLESKSIRPSTAALSRTAIITTFLVAVFAIVVPPNTPKKLKILSQRYTSSGLIQVADSYLGPLPIRYLRQDAGMIGSNALDADGDLADTMTPTNVLQDASRLVQGLKGKRALVFGIGTGYNVRELMSRSWNTTAIEKEQEIYDVAKKYFGMPEPHKVFIGDAMHWVYGEAARSNVTKNYQKFDLIQHDVYTDGELPAQLFTMEFFQALGMILDEHGVVSVSYTGKPRSITMKSTVNMLLNSFGSCKVYHEYPLASPPLLPYRSNELLSIVVFCSHSKDLNFRPIKPSDYAGSHLREGVFMVLRDRELDISKILEGTPRDRYLLKTRDPKVHGWGTEFITEYWNKMREDYPPVIWKSY